MCGPTLTALIRAHGAGTRHGITTAQLDVKLPGGVPLEVVEAAIRAAARGRARLLDAMEAAVPAQRSPTAPVFGSVRVPEGMLGRIIGTGGSTLRELEEAHAARVEVEDSGRMGAGAVRVAGCVWGGRHS